MLTTSPAVFEREKKRAPSVVTECPTGKNGTLRTTSTGKPPSESGAAVEPVPARSDREATVSPSENRRGLTAVGRGCSHPLVRETTGSATPHPGDHRGTFTALHPCVRCPAPPVKKCDRGRHRTREVRPSERAPLRNRGAMTRSRMRACVAVSRDVLRNRRFLTGYTRAPFS